MKEYLFSGISKFFLSYFHWSFCQSITSVFGTSFQATGSLKNKTFFLHMHTTLPPLPTFPTRPNTHTHEESNNYYYYKNIDRKQVDCTLKSIMWRDIICREIIQKGMDGAYIGATEDYWEPRAISCQSATTIDSEGWRKGEVIGRQKEESVSSQAALRGLKTFGGGT